MHWVAKLTNTIVMVYVVTSAVRPAWAMETNTNTSFIAGIGKSFAGTIVLTKNPAGQSASRLYQLHNNEAPALRKTSKQMLDDENQYINSIRRLEVQSGAFAPRLWEKIQGLALTYYNHGKHEEAASVFKRALHVHRVNNGLYNIEQVPILKQMINNHIVMQDYTLADDQQYYLYRTRVQNYQPSDPQYINALREYALWQREAYLLELGDNVYRRLITMHELQSEVLSLAETHFGTNSSKVIPLLEELQMTQYLIASHASTSDADQSSAKYDKSAFEFLRATSYSTGVDILSKKVSLYQNNPQSTIDARVDALVALGDWHQWHKKRTKAFKMYSDAYQLLAKDVDSADRLVDIFSRPQALPVAGTFDSQLAAPKGKKKGHVIAQFTVTDYGTAKGISFVESDPTDYSRTRWQLKKSIKQTLFRPRFEDAVPVETQVVVHRYEFYY